MKLVVAIASGKGGVGKTWIAVSLAHVLALQGCRVLLIDVDIGLANVDVQLGLPRGADLGAVLAGRCRLQEAVRSAGPAGFDVLLGCSGSGMLAGHVSSALRLVAVELAALSADYDVVLLDLPTGLSPAVRQGLIMANTPLIVTTEDPSALTDAYALIKANRLFIALPWIAVNLAAGHEAGHGTFFGLRQICQRFLGLEPQLAGVVRRDRKVQDAILRQASLMTCAPRSAAAGDIRRLARRLLSQGGFDA